MTEPRQEPGKRSEVPDRPISTLSREQAETRSLGMRGMVPVAGLVFGPVLTSPAVSVSAVSDAV